MRRYHSHPIFAPKPSQKDAKKKLKPIYKPPENRWHVRRYHSHPIFAPKPSQKDAENQRNYQALFRCADTGLEPFLGAIVGPFDVQLPTVARFPT